MRGSPSCALTNSSLGRLPGAHRPSACWIRTQVLVSSPGLVTALEFPASPACFFAKPGSGLNHVPPVHLGTGLSLLCWDGCRHLLGTDTQGFCSLRRHYLSKPHPRRSTSSIIVLGVGLQVCPHFACEVIWLWLSISQCEFSRCKLRSSGKVRKT